MSWRAITRLARLSPLVIDQWSGYCRCKTGRQHGQTKMIATRVTESYASFFLTSERDNGSRQAAIARIGAFELRLLEMPSVNSPEEASLWVELYDLELRLGVDSCKCRDLDEAIDAAHLLMIKAKLLNNEAGEAAPSSAEVLQENQ